ncbi:MAG: DUF2752 domain-containing protein [Cytophagaceae bacterium]|nr:DUF2752 domain-containing protein [Cytophagaceae bacterium]
MSKLARHLVYWSVAAVGVAVALIYYRFNPAEVGFFPVCYFRKFTGLHCAGCGGQRALHQLLHGNFREAFRNNALLVLALPYLSLGFVLDMRNFLRGHGQMPAVYRRWEIIVAIFVVICLFWILRNVPVEPFSYLAPVE